MARSMLSFGMLFAFASATAARSRGLPAGSPPPMRAATVISLRIRVKILPRFASAAPFLCLMVLHLLWPDMGDSLWFEGGAGAPQERKIILWNPAGMVELIEVS